MGRICVLGGSGFIGRVIVEKLVEQGEFVIVPRAAANAPNI